MRIVLVTGEYPPMEGGVGAFTMHLAAALAQPTAAAQRTTGAQGHEMHVLTTALAGQPAVATGEDGVTVHRTIPAWGLAALPRIRRALRDLRPDWVDLQYEPAAYGMKPGIHLVPRLLGRSVGAPFAVTFHDLLPPYLFPKAGPLRPAMVRLLARSAQALIVTNAEDLAALRGARTVPPVRLIPIGSNISATPPAGFDRVAWRQAQGFNPQELVVGFFGFINRTKGIETLLESVAALAEAGQPVQVLFIGGRTGTSDVTNAAYAAEVDARIAALGLAARVHRTGFASAEVVSAALMAVDVVALPFKEGANLRHGTLHAALAHGCAIVTTAEPGTAGTGAAAGLEDGRNCVLVPPEDAGALAAAISCVGADPERRRQLGAGARALAARFTWPEIAAETVGFLGEVSDGRLGS